MKIVLDPSKTLIQNVALYHEQAKKFKAKAEGARKAIELSKKQAQKVELKKVEKKKRQWFESFHFFHTSKGTLVVGGRNAHF